MGKPVVPADRNPMPLRLRWRKVFGAGATHLLDELQAAYSKEYGRAATGFARYARNVAFHCQSLPEHRRAAYVGRCRQNLRKPLPEQDLEDNAALYARLERRIGEKAAARLLDQFFAVPLFKPRASDAAREAAWVGLANRIIASRNPPRFIRAIVADGKQAQKNKGSPCVS